jgi:hypothetical protein
MKSYIVEYYRPMGVWVVRIGAKRKDGSFRHVGVMSENKADAEKIAAASKAVAYVREANKLIPKMSLDAAKDVGWEMNWGIDMVTDRLADEDPDHDERDGRGWLA